MSSTWRERKKKEERSNNMYLLPLFPLESGMGGRGGSLSYSGVCGQIKREREKRNQRVVKRE